MPAKKKQQSATARFFRSKAFVFVLLIIIIFALYGYGQTLYRDYIIKKEIQELKYSIQSLNTKNLESLELLQYVMSDSYVDSEARRLLNLKKPEEDVYEISKTSTNNKSDFNEEIYQKEENLNNSTKWWYYFTHRSISNNS